MFRRSSGTDDVTEGADSATGGQTTTTTTPPKTNEPGGPPPPPRVENRPGPPPRPTVPPRNGDAGSTTQADEAKSQTVTKPSPPPPERTDRPPPPSQDTSGLRLVEFGRNAIEAFLRNDEVEYYIDSRGDFLLIIDSFEIGQLDLTISFSVIGDNEDTYSVSGLVGHRFTADTWSDVIGLCNVWNQETIGPKAHLLIPSGADPETSVARAVCETHLDIRVPVPQALIDDFSRGAMGGIIEFARWLGDRTS